MTNVNKKGNIGLIETIRYLTKKGLECFLPLHDYSGIDLIAYCGKTGKTWKIQVKYRTAKGGTIEIPFESIVNGKRIRNNIDIIDVWAVYCPNIDQVIFIDRDSINPKKSSFSFRISPCHNKNKQLLPMYTDIDKKNWYE